MLQLTRCSVQEIEKSQPLVNEASNGMLAQVHEFAVESAVS